MGCAASVHTPRPKGGPEMGLSGRGWSLDVSMLVCEAAGSGGEPGVEREGGRAIDPGWLPHNDTIVIHLVTNSRQGAKGR